MNDGRVLGVKLFIEAGGTQPDNGRELRVGAAPAADVHEGDNDRLRRVLRDVGVGHVGVAGNGREDSISVGKARGHEGGVSEVAAKDLDLGVGGDVRELGKELGPRADVDVDAVFGVLDEELKDVSASGTGGTEHCSRVIVSINTMRSSRREQFVQKKLPRTKCPFQIHEFTAGPKEEEETEKKVHSEIVMTAFA